MPALGRTLVFRFHVPGSEREVVADGVVAWTNPQQEHPVHSLPARLRRGLPRPLRRRAEPHRADRLRLPRPPVGRVGRDRPSSAGDAAVAVTVPLPPSYWRARSGDLGRSVFPVRSAGPGSATRTSSADAWPWPRGHSRPRPGGRCGPDTARRVVRGVGPAQRERVPVVEFEPVACGASATLLVDVAAPSTVPLVDGPPDRGREMARGGRHIALREPLAWSLRPGEAAGFEPLELLGDGLVDDPGQVAVGHRGAHERLEPFQLVAELGAGGELDLVAGGGQGLDASTERAGRRLCLDGVPTGVLQLGPDGVWTR